MRYRRLSSTGDYTFGQGSANFLVDTPATVAQAVLTRLNLWVGEWFLDRTEGTPWLTQILSANIKNVVPLYDHALRTVVLQTPGVVSIESYSSTLDGPSRALSVSMVINTQYGQSPVETVIRR